MVQIDKLQFGILKGAPDITALSLNPFLLLNLALPGSILLIAGALGSTLNTRIMLPFMLMALTFSIPKKHSFPVALLQGAGLFIYLLLNMLMLYAGFYIPGGIQ